MDHIAAALPGAAKAGANSSTNAESAGTGAPGTRPLQAEGTWFHIFRAMIENGDVKKIGPYATTVYLVVKAHTNFNTGRAFPSIDTIAEKSGISTRQIKTSLQVLEQHGYLTKQRSGRHNIYTLREKVEIQDQQGRPAAVASWDYLPNSVTAAQTELKKFLLTGEHDGRIIFIERLYLNIQANSGGENMQANPAETHVNLAALEEQLASNPKLRETIMRRVRGTEVEPGQ